ncbi:hypothetical protein MKK84_24675 [Methylobacterium sp. E-065]|uniref:hypothetical protein n=1 Tax=Methylobacterium sp. E-065 TaxID=2836583 RepID=UPI001FB8A3CF|nr:hypothetical protein [Methylobacterium sp. E-065]MCJ2020584.1 hypothetical protein [Methylobacterium sp. E-065]
MDTEISLKSISADGARGQMRHWEVTFDVEADRHQYEMHVWLDGSVDEADLVPEARAKLHQHLQALADRSKQWSQP